ncbi:hypothetical protein BDV41DRAFT_581917 [Aspergillus transmontanensis]|uniref:Ricin B lectin domain-containing protein n=1 Tax=Aspergillus transmontanensis TaxID=1034304 RepID=A0A5N6VII4_9EURO|nr:hypothetical protein BDV41DRAFT_581917 [Aspergillus transmontanensis]
MSSDSLESGRYYIKSQESGEYLTVSQEDGSIVARPEKEKPFEFSSTDGNKFSISLEGDALGIQDDNLVAGAPSAGWSVTKSQAQHAWVFVEVDGSKGWWLNGEEPKNVNVRPLVVAPCYPPQYPTPELFVLESV